MIKDNVIYFGYGTISVGAMFQEMLFQEIKPPAEIGEALTEKLQSGQVEFTGNQHAILFRSYEECSEFKRLLESVHEAKRFEFCGLVFDFTNYNEKSVTVVKKHLEKVISNVVFLMAC